MIEEKNNSSESFSSPICRITCTLGSTFCHDNDNKIQLNFSLIFRDSDNVSDNSVSQTFELN